MKNRKLYFILILIIGISTYSCVEPFDIKTTTFESVLVVKATITSEIKHQQINLSRTFPLEENGPSEERYANIMIIDTQGNTFNFSEISPGKYISNEIFGAVSNTNYLLKIETADGKSYTSEQAQLTNSSQINNVYAESFEDGYGATIFVDSYNSNGDSRFYKYEFEETYKIIAPKWSIWDLEVISTNPPQFELVLRDENTRVCYNTNYSKGIIQTETNNFSEDRVTKFPIRSLTVDDMEIAYRYSILVKQYVQSQEAYTFYKTLSELSNSESLFSQNQPGFFNGNIHLDNYPNEKIIGFFEVCSVSTKRIFIDPVELGLKMYFPRPYPSTCEYIAPQVNPPRGDIQLHEYIQSKTLKFYEINDGTSIEPIVEPGGPYVMVPYACGDCTVIATNVVPEFWIE
jgi:hypothetical protein